MRISLVIQDLYKLGAQYVTALVARGLVVRGYQVDLVVSKVHDDLARDRPELRPFAVPDEVRWVHLNNRKASRNIWELARYFKSARPDVVMPMSSNYDLASGLAMWLCGSQRPAFMPVEHASGIGLGIIVEPRQGPLRKVFGQLISGLARCKVNRQLVVSEGVRQALVKLHRYSADRIGVVYNPVVDDNFYSKYAGPTAHPWLVEKACPVFVGAGAHTGFKAQDVMIQAFAIVVKKQPCRLILFGEGQLTQKLKDLAAQLGVADRVSFPGFTNNLPAELKAADAFVVSSRCESFSIVLVEALACGTPVVSTDCPSGPPEILHHGKYGILCKPDDPVVLAEGMQMILDGRGIKPPRESWEPYTLDHVMDNYEKEINFVLECRRLKR